VAIPDRLYRLYLREWAREGMAVALAESQEDVLAISPGGLGVGILQQSAAWQADYAPTPSALGEPLSRLERLETWIGSADGGYLYGHAMATDRRWHPAYQIACYATFCFKHKALDRLARLRLYHYGHEQDADPDGYAERVMKFFVSLEGW
jgi:hypothetical protein